MFLNHQSVKLALWYTQPLANTSQKAKNNPTTKRPHCYQYLSALLKWGGNSYPAESILSVQHRFGVHDDLQDVCVLLLDRVVPHAVLALVTRAVQGQLLPHPAGQKASEDQMDTLRAAEAPLPCEEHQ